MRRDNFNEGVFAFFNTQSERLYTFFYHITAAKGVVTAYITEQMKNEKYMAPEAEVLEIAVEQGFAGSQLESPEKGEYD